MLLTPRIVRGHELKQQDIDPVYIGSQQNLGLTGPPPLIGAPTGGTGVAPVTPAPAPPGGVTGQPAPGPGVTGTLPQPGILPQTPAPAPAPTQQPPAPQPEA